LERELERDVRAYQQTPELLIAAVLQRLAKMDVRRRPSADEALSWPVQPVAITSLYGHRFHPILKRRLPHQGLDLAAEEGQPVMAASSGRVVRAGWVGALGQCVEIEHARGMRTRYAHLSQVWVKPNVQVPQGHPIGLAGSTGQSTGAHLHFEVWKGKQPKNPLAELPPPATAPAPTGSLALQRSEGARPVRTP
jgi:murein DD-endopeptidase MepM/ murein hydrolase activator NlpD